MPTEYEGVIFQSEQPAGEKSVLMTDVPSDTEPAIEKPWPNAILPMSEERETALTNWLDKWLNALISGHNAKITQWQKEEKAYRATSDGVQTIPFEGASGDHVPVIAMAVDPIQARLSTGVFKADPVFRIKALKKSMVNKAPALEQLIQHYQKHVVGFRAVAAPRLFEFCKHGTMVYKVVYDRVEYDCLTYEQQTWKTVKAKVRRYAGPRIIGVNLNQFYFPPHYQFLQDCPIVAERIIATEGELQIAEAAGKLVNVDKIIGQTTVTRDEFEQERAKSVNYEDQIPPDESYNLWEIHCDFDVDGDKIPEKLIITYHRETRTYLQRRLNWYFHQRKPYVVIPYTISSDSLYGLGLAEMILPFQEWITQWERHAINNAYLANIRMWKARQDAAVEKRMKVFAGRVVRLADPDNDLKELKLSDVYQSTVIERNNLFGLVEKRTGVSDYLTGRESRIVGSRATATATTALIQEAAVRVEEVLENIRSGFSEIMQLCMTIWMQYGLDGTDDVVFGGDEVATRLKEFFNSVDPSNVWSGIAIDLSVTDAASNRVVQQQMQLAIIQVMMSYLERVFNLGQVAIQSGTQVPQLSQWAAEISSAARTMFKDLLQTYNIRNPEDYLPDLEAFIKSVGNGNARANDLEGLLGRLGIEQGVQSVPEAPGMAPAGNNRPAGNSVGPAGAGSPAGAGIGV